MHSPTAPFSKFFRQNRKKEVTDNPTMNVFTNDSQRPCFVCDCIQWQGCVPAAFDSEGDSFEPLSQFLTHLEAFEAVCSSCRPKPLVALVGQSGSGKSTLINLLAARPVVAVALRNGSFSIDFVGPISNVSASNESATKFPQFLVTASTIYADFPGFFDTRAGALEFVQSVILQKIVSNRDTKIVLVKSLNLDRDAQFLRILDSGLITPGGAMVVLNKAKPKSSTNWADYLDDLTPVDLKTRLHTKFFHSTSLPCVKMLQPEFYSKDLGKDLNSSFMKEFLLTLGRVKAQRVEGMIATTPTILGFANDSLKRVRSLIEVELSERVSEKLKTYQFQPYNLSALKTLLSSTHSTPEPIVTAFKMLGLIEVTSNDILGKYVHYWTLFHNAIHQSRKPSLERIAVGNLLSAHLLEKLTQVTTSTASPQPLQLPEEMPLHTKLMLWTETRETFHLEYVSYKGQLQLILQRARSGGDVYGVHMGEAKRLILYRLERCAWMEDAWCRVARGLQEVMERPRWIDTGAGGGEEMELDVLNGPKEKDWDFEFLGKLMDENALRELLKLGLENRGSIGNMLMVLGGVGVSGMAAVAERVTGVVSGVGAVVGGGSAIEIGSGTIGSSTLVAGVAGAVLVGVGVAVVANYIYARSQRQKQLNEGGVIGLDFSEYGLEKEVWKAALQLLDDVSDEAKVSAIKIDTLFKIYEEKFSWDLGEKRKIVDVRFQEMKDVKKDANDTQSVIQSWVNVVAANQKLMHTIVSKLKGRAKNVSGCSFMEHSLADEYRFFPVTTSCCRYLSASGAKRCIHCNCYFHDSAANKQCLIEARAILCKDKMENPDKGNVSSVKVFFYDDKSFPVMDWSRLASSQKREAARLSAIIYSTKDREALNLKTDFIKDENILYFVTLVDGVVYVIFRGTEPTSSTNWLANATFSLGEYEGCSFHSGYLRICQQILDSVWRKVMDLEYSQVVFAGHSLGGALAHTMHMLCLLTKFESTSIPILSMAFGSPACFGKKTLKFFEEHNLHGRFITFCNQGDPVPMAFKAVEYFERQISSTTGISRDMKAALGIATFVPKVMSQAYVYLGTFVFFDASVRDQVGSGEQAVLWNHQAVDKWMSITKLDECAVEKHHISKYVNFINFQYPN